MCPTAQGNSGNITELDAIESTDKDIDADQPVPGPMGALLACQWEKQFSYNDDIVHLGARYGRGIAFRERTFEFLSTTRWLDGIVHF